MLHQVDPDGADRPLGPVTPAEVAPRYSRLSRFFMEGHGFTLMMIAPAVLLLGFVLGVPILKALWLSFDTINLRRPHLAGTYGLHNYSKLLTDSAVWAAVVRSAIYMLGTVCGSLALALSAALLTLRIVRFRGLARLTFLLPWTVPAVVTALVWGVMYDGNFGIINRMLSLLGFSGANWIVDRDTAFVALILAQVWNEFPMAYVFFLAGLQSIPEELYEAARIDRATAWQQFRHITLPQLRAITSVIVVLLMIMGFKSFPIIFILTGGGPSQATETMTILTYTTAFRRLDFSYAATQGILAIVISLVLVTVYLRFMRGSQS